MTALKPQLFNFNNSEVRFVQINDQNYAVAKDAAEAIGYSNTQKAIRDHVKSKYKLTERIVLAGQNREVTLISEPGLYQLAAQSQLPNAEPFQDWLFEQVLPNINKHGAYMTVETAEKWLEDPDTMIATLQKLKAVQSANKVLEAENKKAAPKVAAYDELIDTNSVVTSSVVADHYGKSAQWLHKKLHEYRVIWKQGDKWLFYAKYKGLELGDSKHFPVTHHDGRVEIKSTLQWTVKGIDFIRHLFAAHGIYGVNSTLKGKE